MADQWLTGPVVVTGASGQVGAALQERLSGLPNDVRPIGRRDDLTAAVRDADVVVHLAGTLRPRRPDTYASSNLETAEAVVAALVGSSVRRVVTLSYLDADPASGNLYLRLKAEAEQRLEATGVPTVVLRAAHIYGDASRPGPTAEAMLSRGGKPVSVLGSGGQRWAWVANRDVVEALTHAALDPSTPTGTYELAGPRALTVDDFVRQVNGAHVRVRHLNDPMARVLSRVLPSLPAPLVDVMLRDCVPTGDPADTASRFGFELHDLDAEWT
ncbi:hypothetical protein NSZ01_16760 [Nocardioides szechwanensis]|uniref:Nucleoside-diphosphate-sugar epimerase n=1 Tax=Nocardioides szechwanensis TaxID=1005944 RepID=A0A1G9ZEE8_9ACTN|nr:NAD-dependent epimerase/dehydratase family protein [Nocardioides szechwanensis]GEP33908.1 hypothetical protein NSZ01_16760 [Nocardioides szechwanensis]SDN19604.1 Nucleoside-diphosphate-sugar epimerase [Nocardioides szechwanensis]